MSTSLVRTWRPGLAAAGAVAGLLFGLALHYLATYVRDHGPSAGSWSLRGNGALAIVLLGALVVVLAEVPLARRRAWLGALLLPVATFLGLFVLAGTV